MAEVELEKVDGSHDCLVSTCIANLDKDEKDKGDKEEEGGEEGKGKASAGRCPDGSRGRMKSGVVGREARGGRRGSCSGFFLWSFV